MLSVWTVGGGRLTPGRDTSPSSHHVLMSLSLSLDPLLVVQTSPELLTTSHNIQFSVNCIARAEVDGKPLTVTIEWRRVTPSGTSELMPALYTTTGSPERGYQSVLTTSENDSTDNTTIYRCTATALGYSSFSDTTVHLDGIKAYSVMYSLQIMLTFLVANYFCPTTSNRGGSKADLLLTSTVSVWSTGSV